MRDLAVALILGLAFGLLLGLTAHDSLVDAFAPRFQPLPMVTDHQLETK